MKKKIPIEIDIIRDFKAYIYKNKYEYTKNRIP